MGPCFKFITYHEVQSYDKQDLQSCKRKLQLPIHANEQHVRDDDQPPEQRDISRSVRSRVPKGHNDSCGGHLGRETDKCSVDEIPALGERKSRIDEVLSVTNDASAER